MCNVSQIKDDVMSKNEINRLPFSHLLCVFCVNHHIYTSKKPVYKDTYVLQ